MLELRNTSVIVPIGPEEQAWKDLIFDLAELPDETEIVFAATHESPVSELFHLRHFLGTSRSVKWLECPKGRAAQLNAGAMAATKRFVWFVHADTRFTFSTLTALERALSKNPETLHYFNLWFLSRNLPLMPFTSLGVWMRSHFLKIPFGDQGFCVTREIFERLGGFDTNAPYGEDHLFVWKARQNHIPIRCTGGWIKTSSRKYIENGWLRTTTRHALLTTKQAASQIFKA